MFRSLGFTLLAVGATVVGTYVGLEWLQWRNLDVNLVNWELKDEVTTDIPPDLPTVFILGDSRTVEIDPLAVEEMTGERMYNLSAGGANLSYYYLALKRLLEGGHPIEKVYIAFSDENENAGGYRGVFYNLFVRYFVKKSEVPELAVVSEDIEEIWRDRQPYRQKYFNGNPFESLWRNPKNLLRPTASNAILRETQKHDRGMRIRARKYPQYEHEGKTLYSFAEVQGQYKVKDRDFNRKSYETVPEISQHFLKNLLVLLDEYEVEYEFFFMPVPKVKYEREPALDMSGLEFIYEMIPPENFDTRVYWIGNKFFYDKKHYNSAGVEKVNRYFSRVVVEDKAPNKKQTWDVKAVNQANVQTPDGQSSE